MMHFLRKTVLLACFSITVVCENYPEKFKITYEHLYELGVDAYLQNRWNDCISFFEKSLEDYFYYQLVLVQCRSRCQVNKLLLNDSTSDVNGSDLKFIESIVKKAACLIKCEHSNLRDRKAPSKTVTQNFESKIPYNYLQLCYYKVDNIEKAVSSAYTFLLHNPNHEVMQTNLQYYLNMPGVDADKIQNLETEDYQELYLEAAHMYAEKRYEDVIELMEKALHEYLLAEEKCRLLCEDPTSDVIQAEIHVAIAHLFTLTLQCKLGCPEKLSNMYGQKHGSILSTAYHYLQYSFYKTGRMKEACEAVSSYLYLHPGDKVMLSNLEYYSKLTNVKPEWFSPREEAVQYQKRHSSELALMQMMESWFQKDKKQMEKIQFPTPPPGSSHVPHAHKKTKQPYSVRERMSITEIEKWLGDKSVIVHMKADDLNGTERAAFRGLASEEECKGMVKLADDGAVFGDGYNGKESPHTEFEIFEGITVARAATLAQRGVLSPESVQLFLDISEKARQVVENYFNLETELYFAYTHLVCRTAFPGSPNERDDLSHPVHADNCMLMPDGECVKKLPAYIWRDYSSIVYLNDDFEGGEFIFAENKKNVQASVKPGCGVMVAFSAGKENLHGVKAVRKGRRCALAMWYTLDPQHKEHEREFAQNIIADLIEKRKLLRKSSGSAAAKLYKQTTLDRLTGKNKIIASESISQNSKRDEL